MFTLLTQHVSRFEDCLKGMRLQQAEAVVINVCKRSANHLDAGGRYLTGFGDALRTGATGHAGRPCVGVIIRILC